MNPPQENCPSTNMSKKGGMKTLKLTYSNQKQFELG